MKSLLALALLIALAIPGTVPCKSGGGCVKVGRFCHIGNWSKCCCPFNCLGKFVGLCLRPFVLAQGNMTYTIKDANDQHLLHDTIFLDEKAVVSQEQLDTLVARFGDQPLYLDADIHYSGEDVPENQSHETVRGHKLN